MKKIIFLMGLLMIVVCNGFSQNKSDINIIPDPVSLKVTKGYFWLEPSTIIYCKSSPSVNLVATELSSSLNEPTGFHLKVLNRIIKHKTIILLKLNRIPDKQLDSAGYTLLVTPQRVIITANKTRGLFYGTQTLLQLLPKEIVSVVPIKNIKWKIPCATIEDYPRFAWRGLMFDVSRHFYTKGQVEAYINEMAKYKFNIFHWHLTDDQGWRIQIKGLPQLTTVGAWRVPRTGSGPFTPPQPGEKDTYGGFYTDRDIREIVAYAQKRYITILPEIDVPGHSGALIAAFPNLSSTGEGYPISAPGTVFNKRPDNVLCVGDDSTWIILKKIFAQVAQLFPCKYIHVGGDEVDRAFWADPKDRALMKKEGIKNTEGLKSYFEKRLSEIIKADGKEMMGWDEITKGGLPDSAAVMCRFNKTVPIALNSNASSIIMTPYRTTYLDYYQGDPLVEPKAQPIINRLSNTYKTSFIAAGVNPARILGGEGCLWTEYVPNFRHAEYMTWPRALALAEVFWSPKKKLNWNSFIRRVEVRKKYMDIAHVKYSNGEFEAIITGVKGPDDSLEVKLSTKVPGEKIYYRFDGTNPDNFSPEYKGYPLKVPTGASQINVVTYYRGRLVGRQINCPLEVLKRRM